MIKFQWLIIFILGTSVIQSSAQNRFIDVSKEAGIDHQFGVYEGFLGGGVCILDINNDGFEDIFLTGGMNDDRLYLNQKDGTFKDIYRLSGMLESSKYVTQGVASADVNKDGFVDLFITTNTRKDKKLPIPRAKNLLFLNKGDNTFVDATDQFGLGKLLSFSTGISFGDVNKDGFPDAYVGNYFHEYTGELDVINDATIVNASTTAQGYLLINHEGKKFVDEYEKYGLNHKGFDFGGVFTDFDNDGDQDLIVNHDFGYKATQSHLLENLYPEVGFKYVEEEKGTDLHINAMTSAVGDYDNNGWLDYFVTNIKFNLFMVSENKAHQFIDRAAELGTRLFTISWGANFSDFDQDGDLDLFVANGDLNPNCTPMFNYYFENQNGKFEEMASRVGVNSYGISRGSVVFDMDNDGDNDLLVVNQKPVLNYPVPSSTILYRNDSVTGNYIQLNLNGTVSDTRGIGARVKIYIDSISMIREVDGGGSSHLSQNSTNVHFGLGSRRMVDSIIISWPSGLVQKLRNQKANQKISVTEDLILPDKSNNYFMQVAIVLLVLAISIIIKKKFIKT